MLRSHFLLLVAVVVLAGAERWVGRNGLPVLLALTVPLDEAHECYTPTLL